MSRNTFTTFLSAASLTAMVAATPACERKTEAGLPAASSLQVASGTGTPTPSNTPPKAGGSADPHAGMAMPPGHPPTAANPHAAVDMNNPHGGQAGGVDVAQLGLPPPDPNRAIATDRFLRGTIRPAKEHLQKVKQGGAVFVTAKRVGADGMPTGAPLAVEKLEFKGESITFDLTEADAMIAGTKLEGEVVISARYDQDHDAISKQPGDVAGTLKVKVPAGGLDLVLDQPL